MGIDGGGSKCKAIITDSQGNILGSGIAGAANAFHDVDFAIESILSATHQAISNANLTVDIIAELHACLGLAGVNIPEVLTAMQAWQHPFKCCEITTDLAIACLAAHEQMAGAVIVIGTGSCGYFAGDDKQQAISLGGYGFPLGDQASGAWLGLQAITQSLLSIDGIIAKTLLTDLIFKYLSLETAEQLVQISAAKTATFYAQLAPLVFKAAGQGDEIATDILQQGADYIDQMVLQLTSFQPSRISLLGGLAPWFMPLLREEVQVILSPAKQPPEFGAVLLAKKIAQKNFNKNVG